MKKIDGRWLPVKAVLNGQTVSTSLDNIILDTSDSQFRFGTDAGSLQYLAPGEIDITRKEGPNQGKTFKAIYAIKPDLSEMTICYNINGGERPAVFLSPKGMGLLLVTYKRST